MGNEKENSTSDDSDYELQGLDFDYLNDNSQINNTIRAVQV